MFYRVNEEKLFDINRTYNSLINLLDNDAVHFLNFLDKELTDEREIAEQQDFLHLILKKKPIPIALEYINQNFGDLNQKNNQMLQTITDMRGNIVAE